ncbi:MAG TPA: ECF-type sigma factor [Candidatus Sulfotelmatobacter sp.]|nr:ECF-type sigma factor [Candidatus Sulfotelmatobacter sp.]
MALPLERCAETDGSRQVTELLVRWRKGDHKALDALIPLVYEELRRIAQHFLQRERSLRRSNESSRHARQAI